MSPDSSSFKLLFQGSTLEAPGWLSSALTHKNRRLDYSRLYEIRSEIPRDLLELLITCQNEEEFCSRVELSPDSANDIFLLAHEFGLERLEDRCKPLLPPPDPQFEFPFDKAKSLTGLFAHLKRRFGGEKVSKACQFTQKSEAPISQGGHQDGWFSSDEPRLLKFLPRGDATPKFERWMVYTENKPGQWICIDFVENRVRPTNYTMIAVWLQSWVIEVSMDGENWVEIDRKTKVKDFHYNAIASFQVAVEGEGRFVRLTQTGPNQAGGHTLWVEAFELFGRFLE
jgi:hypothetical protein